MLDRTTVQEAVNAGAGVLRLEPSWVPRSFMIPGRRLKLHPDDIYAFGAQRGGINERWFSSTTKASNGPATTPDEGLSYVHPDGGSKFLLKDAVECAGDILLGADVMEREGGWNLLCKFFDNLGPIPGLVAASALLIDYVLTVAVSVASGVAALASETAPLPAEQ